MERDGEDYEGTILAAYRIQTHFDIQKAYNQATGEEYNILSENMSDRPWYDREYIRVGLVNQLLRQRWPRRLLQRRKGAAGQIHALSFFKECEDGDRNAVDGTCNSEPDAPVFVADNPDTAEDETYFDITSLATSLSQVVPNMWGYRNIPLLALQHDGMYLSGIHLASLIQA